MEVRTLEMAPEGPILLELTNHSSRSFRARWTAPPRPNGNLSYTLYYKTIGNTHTHREMCHLCLTHVNEQVQYNTTTHHNLSKNIIFQLCEQTGELLYTPHKSRIIVKLAKLAVLSFLMSKTVTYIKTHTHTQTPHCWGLKTDNWKSRRETWKSKQ